MAQGGRAEALAPLTGAPALRRATRGTRGTGRAPQGPAARLPGPGLPEAGPQPPVLLPRFPVLPPAPGGPTRAHGSPQPGPCGLGPHLLVRGAPAPPGHENTLSLALALGRWEGPEEATRPRPTPALPTRASGGPR